MSPFKSLFAGLALITAAGALTLALAQQGPDDLARLTQLEGELDSLEREIQLLEDTKAIKRVQRAYGYYVDKKLSDEIGDLFADDATAEIGGLGVFVGKARITEFYDWVMDGELQDGQLYNHIILQGVINVDPNGSTAKGRWRALIQTGELGESADWSEGPYENEYVKENGVWKFSKVHWYQTFAAPYSPGWHMEQIPMAEPSEEFPPDRPPTIDYQSYPGAYLPPYHYDNPVSGRTLAESQE
jgi:hypothetical protein